MDQGIKFTNKSRKALQELRAANVMAALISDTAVGYIMEKVDMVLVGAESVFENGGIMNQIGTFQIAICAKKNNKPFYVLTESYKFVKMFPLDQYDLPFETKPIFKNTVGTDEFRVNFCYNFRLVIPCVIIHRQNISVCYLLIWVFRISLGFRKRYVSYYVDVLALV
jgi:hypothetical protein